MTTPLCTRLADCKASSHYSNCESMPSTLTLEELIRAVDALFGSPRAQLNETYVYHLGRMPSGWRFTVVDSWYRWMDKGLEHQFGLYDSPAEALTAFLKYVKDNNIDVTGLMEEGSDQCH